MVSCWSSLNSGAFSACVSAFFLFLGTLVLFLAYSGVSTDGVPYTEVDKHLESGTIDIEKLRDTWAWRAKAYPSVMSALFFLVLGLLFCVHAVWLLKKIHRRYEGNAPQLMASCFAISAALPALQFVQSIGSSTAAYSLYRLDLTADQLISLEFSYLVNDGSGIWVRAMLYVFSGIGFFIACYLTFTEQTNNKLFGILSCLNGIDGISVFALEVLSFSNPGVRIAYVVLLLFWAGIGVPSWLILMAISFYRKQKIQVANEVFRKQQDDSELQETRV